MHQKVFIYVHGQNMMKELVDKDLEEEMDLAYKIVKLGRSARNAANIKNRQPLSKMLVSLQISSRILWRYSKR